MATRPSVVIVGAGVMGGLYARTIARGALRYRVALGGVCDIDGAAATRVADETGTKAFTDLRMMLEEVRPALAYVAVPDHLHREPFLECMRQGVPTLVEKPLATTLDDATAMRDAAARAGVLAEVNFSNHWNPTFMRANEAIAAGTIGEVIGTNARLSNALDFPLRQIPWASRSTSGWFLLSHVFETAAWLTGAHAAEVTANGVRGRKLASAGVDTYDLIQCLVRYAEGWSGLYESAWVLPNSLPSPIDYKFEIIGTEGAIYIDTHDQMVHVAGAMSYKYPGILDWTETRLTALLDRLDAGDVSLAPMDAGVENTALLVALHESLGSREPVRLETATSAASAG